jgi:hypothetical protein
MRIRDVLFAVVVAVLAINEARADFKNGGFDNGITDWKVEYGSVLGNCTQLTGGWQATQFGHNLPGTVNQYQDYTHTIPAFCGGQMLQMTASAYGQQLKATRISQEVPITAEELAGTCGAVRISFKYLLAMTTGEAHSHNILTEAFFRIEILKNGVVIETRTATPHRPFQPPWWNPTGPVYAILGSFETVVRSLVLNDKVAIRLTMGQCCDTGGHGGVVYVDCVSLKPAPDAFSAPTSWGNQSAREWRVGDFDGNGQDDLLDWNFTAQVTRASGPGFLAAAPWSLVPLSSQGRGAVGDFNGDGRDDLLDYRTSSGAYVHLSTGGGFSTGTMPWSGVQPASGRVYAGDFDGDGRSDMLFQMAGVVPRVFRSNGTGFGGAETNWTTQTATFGAWYVGDFNGDAKSDLGRWSAAGGFEVMLSTGLLFKPPQTWTRHSPLHSGVWRIGDFDCDGRDDLMRDSPGAFADATAEVLRSDGTQFLTPVAWYAGINRVGLTAKLPLIPGDFDGTGSDDLEAGSLNVYRSCSACACMDVIDKGAVCDPNNAMKRTWTFAVRNRTTLPVTSVAITTVGGVGIVPATVNLSPPLLPGYGRNVTVSATHVSAGNHCVTVALRNASEATVCSKQVCFQAGDCACSDILVDSLECTTDGSGDVLMSFRVKNASGWPSQQVNLAGRTPTGVAFTPSSFAMNIASGVTSAPMATRVSKVSGSNVMCFDFNVLYINGEDDLGICPNTTCIDIPICPGTPGWCCTGFGGCVSVPHALACQQAGGTFSTNFSICATCPAPPWFPTQSHVSTAALGSALVNVSPDGWLAVSGIGSSGEDGVDVSFTPVLRGELSATIDPTGEVEDGSWVGAAIRGKLNGVPESELGSVRVQKNGDGFNIVPEFAGLGAELHDVEMYQDGVLVGVRGARSGVFQATGWPDGLGGLKQDIEGLAYAGVLLRWRGGAMITIDGQVYNANEARVLASSAGGELGSVSGMKITGSNVPQIEFESADVVPDDAARCLSDLNGDALVDDFDFVEFLPAYEVLVCEDVAMPSGCAADFNHDGFVDDADFVLFLVEYNRLICP